MTNRSATKTSTRGSKAMKNWTVLAGMMGGRDLVVVGNGPSRLGRGDWLVAAQHSGHAIVACNAYWRELGVPEPDYLACYEAQQAELALKARRGTKIVVPQQGLDPICTVFTSEADDRYLYEAAPYRGAGDWERVVDEQWWPGALGVGNLSGLMAYQLAMILRPRAVYLFGVDCCGLTLAGSDQVVLSAIDGAPGYGPARAPARLMRGGVKTPAPGSWDQYRSLWRALTRRAEQAGIPTFRVADAGALDWIEVKDPCPD